MNQTNGSVLGLLTPGELAQAGLLGILDHVRPSVTETPQPLRNAPINFHLNQL